MAKPTNGNGKRSRDVLTRNRPLAESVLRFIWKEKQTTRAYIAKTMELSRSTASEIVDMLLKTGLIAEVGAGRSSGGRRPIVLEFQDNACSLLGVDVGATHVSVAMTNLRGKVLKWKEKRHPVRTDPTGTRQLVIDMCDDIVESMKGVAKPVVRIGVAVPSPVDPLNPEWISETVIPAWQGESGLAELRERYAVPVHIDNDANLGALAEMWWGAGRNVSDFVYIKIAHGIGAGYILNGQIYRGARGVAGEMGHLPIDPSGRKCVCGMHGCLATFVSAPSLAERVVELLPQYPNSLLGQVERRISTIVDAALQDDPLANQVVAEVSDYLSIAITGLFNMINPKLVILGGGLARLDEKLLKPMREKVHSSILVSSAAADIRSGELGSQTIALGAATFALEALITDPELYRNGEHG